MDIWIEVKKLQGQTLHTLDQNKPFDILEVRETGLIIRPHEHGNRRAIKRINIEAAAEDLLRSGEISRVEIRQKYSKFNPAYVASVLAKLPNVTCRIRPIRLSYHIKSTKG